MKVICITPHQKEDYLASCIIEGLKKLNVEIIHTDAGNGLKGYTSDPEILQHAGSASAVLAIWSKKRNPGPRFHLLDMIGKQLPVAYIDGSEYNCAGYPGESHPWIHPGMLKRCDYYFKRECMPADLQQGVLPLPFAARDKDFVYPIHTYPRDNDVFCAFGQNKMDPMRGRLEIACKDNNWMTGKFRNEDYVRFTYGSKIGVNAHGGGEDCMRFWEIIAAGAACFTQKLNIIMPHPFTDGVNMVEFKDEAEFVEKTKFYLENPDMLERIAAAGYNHLVKYHTTRERARYILETMGWDYPDEA
jgi:hypothetical protein